LIHAGARRVGRCVDIDGGVDDSFSYEIGKVVIAYTPFWSTIDLKGM